jgi:predicted nucleotidyltransferase
VKSMVTLDTLRRDKKAEILRLAARHGCRNIRVFGSVATGENGPNSDVDFLVDLDFGRGLLDLGGLLSDLHDCWASTWIWSSPAASILILGTGCLPRPCLCKRLCPLRTRSSM